jgi:hypothetical protein
MKRDVFVILVINMLIILSGCKKLLEVNKIDDRLLMSQVYENPLTANAAIDGIYANARNAFPLSTTVYNSLSGDDVINYSVSQVLDDYRTNLLQPTTTLPWSNIYNTIYAANAALEGLYASKNLPATLKSLYSGEAKFNRAFCYFYLLNLFGDVPLVLSTDVTLNARASRVPSDQVWAQVVADLVEAQDVLSSDYSAGNGERIRANKYVATAFLARVYLYQKQWGKADAEASKIISSELYSVLNSPAGIFIKNNTEAILQWPNGPGLGNNFSSNFIFTTTPVVICSNYLLNAFEVNDLRRSVWIGARQYSGQTYYYPFKFTTTATNSNEWYTVMRLAEQYLIRAEARAMQNDLAGAISDVNYIRLKHGGLQQPLIVPATQAACLDIIMRERQVELFTEGMHRWFDLKRTGRINGIMQAIKPMTWRPTASLYPLPLTEIQRNPNLVQNPGYDDAATMQAKVLTHPKYKYQ